jgi:hypothetical protein
VADGVRLADGVADGEGTRGLAKADGAAIALGGRAKRYSTEEMATVTFTARPL